jgi:hypothetical protein
MKSTSGRGRMLSHRLVLDTRGFGKAGVPEAARFAAAHWAKKQKTTVCTAVFYPVIERSVRNNV